MELGLLNHWPKENTSRQLMMEQLLPIKHMLVHGKDGIWKDTEIMFIFKVANLNIIIGVQVD